MKTIVSASLAGATLLGVAARVPADTPAPTVPTYTATYAAEYKGKNLGSSEFKVTHDPAKNTYEFTSTTIAKGILGKLAAPNPTVQRSIFTVVDGKVRPSEYWYKDGTRKADGDKHIQFDWNRHIATVSDKDGRREVSLDDISLDDGSLYVALMQDLIVNGKPGQYRIADSEQAKTYGFEDKGEAQIDTGLGKLDDALLHPASRGLVEDYVSLGGAAAGLPARADRDAQERRSPDGAHVDVGRRDREALAASHARERSQVFGSVTPCWPWYLPPRSLYDVSHTSSDSKKITCATPSFA